MTDVDPTMVASVEQAIDKKAPIQANIPWRARIAILALILVIIILVAEAIDGQKENQKLLKQTAAQQAAADKARQDQIANIASLLIVVQQGIEAANSHGTAPAVTIDQAVNALKESGFTQDIIDQAIKEAGVSGPPGPQGPTGPAGPAGASATTTSTARATTTSTTRPPTTTTSTTRPGPPMTTTTTRCTLNLLGAVKVGC